MLRSVIWKGLFVGCALAAVAALGSGGPAPDSPYLSGLSDLTGTPALAARCENRACPRDPIGPKCVKSSGVATNCTASPGSCTTTAC
jgi:hypothetical protein